LGKKRVLLVQRFVGQQGKKTNRGGYFDLEGNLLLEGKKRKKGYTKREKKKDR